MRPESSRGLRARRRAGASPSTGTGATYRERARPCRRSPNLESGRDPAHLGAPAEAGGPVCLPPLSAHHGQAVDRGHVAGEEPDEVRPRRDLLQRRLRGRLERGARDRADVDLGAGPEVDQRDGEYAASRSRGSPRDPGRLGAPAVANGGREGDGRGGVRSSPPALPTRRRRSTDQPDLVRLRSSPPPTPGTRGWTGQRVGVLARLGPADGHVEAGGPTGRGSPWGPAGRARRGRGARRRNCSAEAAGIPPGFTMLARPLRNGPSPQAPPRQGDAPAPPPRP